MSMTGNGCMSTTRLSAPVAVRRDGVSPDALLWWSVAPLSRQGLALPRALTGTAALAAPSKSPYGIDDEAYRRADRSEDHTSDIQSLMRTSYAVVCLPNKHKN